MEYSGNIIAGDIASQGWNEPLDNQYIWDDAVSSSGGGNGYIVIDGTSTSGTITDNNDNVTINDYAFGNWEKDGYPIYNLPDNNNIELTEIIETIIERFQRNYVGLETIGIEESIKLMEKVKEILILKGMWQEKNLNIEELVKEMEKKDNPKPSYLEDELFEI